ncbi:sodium/proline symporter PutP [Halarsenatibacter silvermanii]|uniref:Sodium/proline symporter n=1 Tax=Halarsenatibacter silvermanii TaxID=321763 RepID=A0A1G9HER4_9FIRM|nr:sodium/proline symporter PutP [Halarsenatibacter silvermanii]SDL11490.1 sodium/proline symporter [Halarsenatibacter silvermanii]
MDPVLTTFALYIVGMMVIGYYFYKRNQDTEDYFLGDRGLNAPVTALSAQASDMSGWLLMGFPGAVYAGGFSAMWIGIGLAIGTYLNWQFTASRLRYYTEIVDSITLTDFFESRYKDDSRALRIVTGLVILVFFTIYVSSGLVAGGTLFETILGVDYNIAVYISVIIIALYTYLGGYLAVSWSDFVQGSLMFIALVIVPVAVILNMGGLSELWAQVSEVNRDLLYAFRQVDFDPGNGASWLSTGEGVSFVDWISNIGWGLGYFGMPHIIIRFMSIDKGEDLPTSQFIGVTWVVVTLIGAVFVGIIGIVTFAEPLGNPETVFLDLLQYVMNPWIGGIFLAAVLAAIMSTVDSQLLVSSSALTEDFYKAFFSRDASDRELLIVSRVSVVLITLVALYFAMAGGRILDIVGYAWAGLGSAFGPAVLFSLYWKKTNKYGVLAGILIGGVNSYSLE